MILTLKNNIRGGISSIMGDRYVTSDENKKISYVDTNNLFGWAMSQSLPYDEIRFGKNKNLEDKLNTPYDSSIGYFLEIDWSYPYNMREKTLDFSVLS